MNRQDELVELVAKALWGVVDYPRGFEWAEHPSEDVRENYRDRARRLLGQFDIRPHP